LQLGEEPEPFVWYLIETIAGEVQLGDMPAASEQLVVREVISCKLYNES
jgi:hypothetical protein